jgi:hypothetical protein
VLDDNVLEGSLGSIYDDDADGLPGADEDSTKVSLGTTSSGSRRLLHIGQMTIGQGGKDIVEQIDDEAGVIVWQAADGIEKPGNANAPRFREQFTVRIIKALGVGWVHWQENAGVEDLDECLRTALEDCKAECQGDACDECSFQTNRECERRDLARIDCRPGVERPAFE